MGEPIEQNDAEKARYERERRRNERKAACTCGSRPRKNRTRRVLSQNPFIIFFLEMYFKTPNKHVTVVAREAGKAWCALPEEERKKYIQLAERVRTRRRNAVANARKRKRERQSIC